MQNVFVAIKTFKEKRMLDKTYLIEKTMEYFKQRELIKRDDVSLIGIQILKPGAIFYNPKKLRMVCNGRQQNGNSSLSY